MKVSQSSDARYLPWREGCETSLDPCPAHDRDAGLYV